MAIYPELVATFPRNRWRLSSGISGDLSPESALAGGKGDEFSDYLARPEPESDIQATGVAALHCRIPCISISPSELPSGSGNCVDTLPRI